MKKLTHSAAARAAAFILCLLCGLTALLCAAGYFMTRIDRDRTLPEPDSVSVYQNGIRVLLNNALQEERDTGEYPGLPSGYSYVATDTSTGKVLYDGRTKNAVPLGISGGCSSGCSARYLLPSFISSSRSPFAALKSISGISIFSLYRSKYGRP